MDVNERQKHILAAKIINHFKGDLKGKRIAIWGLAFKPNTDDVREAPAAYIIKDLLQAGATVTATDPEAIPNFRQQHNLEATYSEDMYDVLVDADALAIVTEWNEFRTPDFQRMKTLMKTPFIFDGRNIYDPEDFSEQGFFYSSIGREIVHNK